MEEVQDWLKKAERDLHIARIAVKELIYEDACFHAQQAAEKALKALYIKQKNALKKIHDLTALGKEVNAPNEIILLCNDLNPYYIATRYPGPDEPIEKEEAQEVVGKTEKVIEWVKERL
jgi:HEPN domain-containing protein